MSLSIYADLRNSFKWSNRFQWDLTENAGFSGIQTRTVDKPLTLREEHFFTWADDPSLSDFDLGTCPSTEATDHAVLYSPSTANPLPCESRQDGKI